MEHSLLLESREASDKSMDLFLGIIYCIFILVNE